jgi:predicted RNA binding protein YcfA (HicA-like mRNA interferase family)
MPELPVVSGEKAVSAFIRAGWTVARSGNHIILTMRGSIVSLSVPNHKEVSPGTPRKLIRLSGLTVEEFTDYLK